MKTALFMGITAVIWIVYDVWVIAEGGTEASISHLIYEWSYKYPLFTLAFGILIGHFFWRIRDTETTKRLSDNSRK
jgi:hypothetical protein